MRDWFGLGATEPRRLWPYCIAMVEQTQNQVCALDARMAGSLINYMQQMAEQPAADRVAVVMFWMLVNAYPGAEHMVLTTMCPVRWSPAMAQRGVAYMKHLVGQLESVAFSPVNMLRLAAEMHALLCYDVNTQRFQVPLPPLYVGVEKRRRAQQEREATSSDMRAIEAEARRNMPPRDERPRLRPGMVVDDMVGLLKGRAAP
jgi:hypothetical protein